MSDTPVLRGHAGTQPDLFLRWNDIPADAERVDVVVHLHGFSQQRGAMKLEEKVPRSGFELTGRARPTLAVMPRGNWIQQTWYDFPALLDGGVDRLIAYALDRFAAAMPPPQPSPAGGGGGTRIPSPASGGGGTRIPSPASGGGQGGGAAALDRLILTAHSGGGMPAIDAISGAARKPDELHIFDGLYGRDPAAGDPMRGLEAVEAWLAERFAAEPRRPGALRVIYIENQTGPFSRAVGRLIERRLTAVPGGLAAILAPRYRVEQSAVPHGYVAAVCGPVLLADPGADFDWANIV